MVKSRKLKQKGHDEGSYENFVQSYVVKGFTREQAEAHTSMYRHHFRKYV